MIKLAWDGHHKDSAVWTKHLLNILERSHLPALHPKDGSQWHPNFDEMNLDERVVFYAHLFSEMVKPESNFKPKTIYQEPGGHSGPGTLSIGLLQLSVEDDHNYDLGMGLTKLKLFDPLINLTVAVKIAEHWVEEDGRIAGHINGHWRGFARYWSCMRAIKNGKARPSYETILRHVRRVSL